MKLNRTFMQKAPFILGGSLFCLIQNGSGQIQTGPPNFLIIITDLQAWDAVGYAGNKLIKTPNIDRLAKQGINFSRAVTPCPVSVPARTSILTGRLAETTTIRDNTEISKNVCYFPTFDEILVKREYIAECHGKFHLPNIWQQYIQIHLFMVCQGKS